MLRVYNSIQFLTLNYCILVFISGTASAVDSNPVRVTAGHPIAINQTKTGILAIFFGKLCLTQEVLLACFDMGPNRHALDLGHRGASADRLARKITIARRRVVSEFTKAR